MTSTTTLAPFHTANSQLERRSDTAPPSRRAPKKQEKWVFSSLPRRGTPAATALQAAGHERLTCHCSAGYALFKSKDKKLLSKGDELSKDVSTVVESLKLKKFTKFDSAVTALNEAAALTDGKVSSMLGNLLQELKDETKASRTTSRLRMGGIVKR